jgi:hypothetical protein
MGGLLSDDVDRPLPLLFCFYLKRYKITLLERIAKSGLLDIALMKEDLFSPLRGNESISFRAVEEFHCTSHALIPLVSTDGKKKAPAETPGPVL